MGPRIYPLSRVAAAIVWLLDRLPESVRSDVLGSYWSPEALELARIRGKEIREQLGIESPTTAKGGG